MKSSYLVCISGSDAGVCPDEVCRLLVKSSYLVCISGSDSGASADEEEAGGLREARREGFHESGLAHKLQWLSEHPGEQPQSRQPQLQLNLTRLKPGTSSGKTGNINDNPMINHMVCISGSDTGST